MKKASLMELTKQETGMSDHFSLTAEHLSGGILSHFFEVLNRIQSPGNLHGQQVGPIERGKAGDLMDRTNRFNSGYSARSDLFGDGQFSERSRPEQVEIPGDGSHQSPVGILAKNHPFPILKGDGRMRRPALVKERGLAVLFEESF